MPNHEEFQFRAELFTEPSKAFKKHLEISGNNRILFSGRFGIGKSYFLTHFFNEETQKSELRDIKYEAFFLSPVTYSIANTEDIFRFIKYDIITTMLLKGLALDNIDWKYIDTIPAFLRENPLKTLALLVYMIPKVGKDISDFLQDFEDFKKDFLKHHKSKTRENGDELIEFLEKIEAEEGSAYENDEVTKIIHAILAKSKNDNGKENILIIDDFDRIDPEHVFRILNVFAAHLTNNELSNKLGFDKIIIVCDIDNIRSIFKSKYGNETDFNGYIDKFYNTDIFHLDNRKTLKSISNETLRNIAFPDMISRQRDYRFNAIFSERSVVFEITELLIKNGMLNLRTLVKKHTTPIYLDPKPFIFDKNKYVDFEDVPILAQFKILKELIGSYDNLKASLSKIPFRLYEISNIDSNTNIFLYFLNFEKLFDQSETHMVSFREKNYYFNLQGFLKQDMKKMISYEVGPVGIVSTPAQYRFSLIDFKESLLEFIDLLKRIDE